MSCTIQLVIFLNYFFRSFPRVIQKNEIENSACTCAAVRLLTLGRVRFVCSPSPFPHGLSFRGPVTTCHICIRCRLSASKMPYVRAEGRFWLYHFLQFFVHTACHLGQDNEHDLFDGKFESSNFHAASRLAFCTTVGGMSTLIDLFLSVFNLHQPALFDL